MKRNTSERTATKIRSQKIAAYTAQRCLHRLRGQSEPSSWSNYVQPRKKMSATKFLKIRQAWLHVYIYSTPIKYSVQIIYSVPTINLVTQQSYPYPSWTAMSTVRIGLLEIYPIPTASTAIASINKREIEKRPSCCLPELQAVNKLTRRS